MSGDWATSSHEPLEELARAECVQLLRSARVGRIVYSWAALPAVTPARYVMLDDEDILCQAWHASQHGSAFRDALVGLHVDEIDQHGRSGWSVLVHGQSSGTTTPEDWTAAAAAGLSLQRSEEFRQLLKFTPGLISGYRAHLP